MRIRCTFVLHPQDPVFRRHPRESRRSDIKPGDSRFGRHQARSPDGELEAINIRLEHPKSPEENLPEKCRCKTKTPGRRQWRPASVPEEKIRAVSCRRRALQGGPLVLILRRLLVALVVDRPGTEPASGAASAGSVVLLVSMRRRLCSMARRPFTSLNSEVLTHVLRLGLQDVRDVLLAALDAVVRHRMRREDLGHRSRFLLLERLDLLEEVDERRRIVAGLVHVLEAQHVGFGLQIRARTSGSPAESPGPRPAGWRIRSSRP